MTTSLPADTKDWTWVLLRPCPECGFDRTAAPGPAVAALLRPAVRSWAGALRSGGDVALRTRIDRWSTLEYGCHVRDVLRLGEERLTLMLTVDEPDFANWDQDATAIADRYETQDPLVVAAEIQAAGFPLADHLERVGAGEWTRPAVRSDGAHFTVESFAAYVLHDIVHHLHDIGLSPAA